MDRPTFSELRLSRQRTRTRSGGRDSSGPRCLQPGGWPVKRSSASHDRNTLGPPATGTSISGSGTDVRRWDGNNRMTTDWDCIRKDPELWFPSGDCFVHFYAKGASRRGPSLRIFLADVEESHYGALLDRYHVSGITESPTEDSTSSADAAFSDHPYANPKYELYIPSPPHLGREAAHEFHLTTRNFFAWMFGKPMVGRHLGEALVLAQERMAEFRQAIEGSREDMVAYIDAQGYSDYRHCPDHAMAIMYYAEKYKDTTLWTDAFVHCVGMYDILNSSIEFPTVSRTSGALITRSHLEMTLRLEHAYADLSTFMEDSISVVFPGLPEQALKHLDRFRSFLQSYYVQRHGYWPPPCLQPNRNYNVLTKSLLRSMYTDFRHIYEYLCDPRSCPNPAVAQIEAYRTLHKGIYTPAVILAFDKRYKNTSLPHPLPLLPSSGPPSSPGIMPVSAKPPSNRAFSQLFRPLERKSTRVLNTCNSLAAATNRHSQPIMDSPMVQEYARFEREWTMRGEERIKPVEARKIRWLLIYALLQTVVAVVCVPNEVRDIEGVEYPLCVQTGGTPPWNKRPRTKATVGSETPRLQALSTGTSGEVTPEECANIAHDRVPRVPELVLSQLQTLATSSSTLSTIKNVSSCSSLTFPLASPSVVSNPLDDVSHTPGPRSIPASSMMSHPSSSSTVSFVSVQSSRSSMHKILERCFVIRDQGPAPRNPISSPPTVSKPATITATSRAPKASKPPVGSTAPRASENSPKSPRPSMFSMRRSASKSGEGGCFHSVESDLSGPELPCGCSTTIVHHNRPSRSPVSC